jgi:plastocyanin
MTEREVEVQAVRRLALVLALAGAAVLATGACGSSSDKSSSSNTTSGSSSTTAPTGTTGNGSAAGSGQDLTIQNFRFNPDPLQAKAGRITVTNMDQGTFHSVTADDGSFDTDTFTNTDGPKTINVSKTGTFRFHCKVHNFMHGTIQVT